MKISEPGVNPGIGSYLIYAYRVFIHAREGSERSWKLEAEKDRGCHYQNGTVNNGMAHQCPIRVESCEGMDPFTISASLSLSATSSFRKTSVR